MKGILKLIILLAVWQYSFAKHHKSKKEHSKSENLETTLAPLDEKKHKEKSDDSGSEKKHHHKEKTEESGSEKKHHHKEKSEDSGSEKKHHHKEKSEKKHHHKEKHRSKIEKSQEKTSEGERKTKNVEQNEGEKKEEKILQKDVKQDAIELPQMQNVNLKLPQLPDNEDKKADETKLLQWMQQMSKKEVKNDAEQELPQLPNLAENEEALSQLQNFAERADDELELPQISNLAERAEGEEDLLQLPNEKLDLPQTTNEEPEQSQPPNEELDLPQTPNNSNPNGDDDTFLDNPIPPTLRMKGNKNKALKIDIDLPTILRAVNKLTGIKITDVNKHGLRMPGQTGLFNHRIRVEMQQPVNPAVMAVLHKILPGTKRALRRAYFKNRYVEAKPGAIKSEAMPYPEEVEAGQLYALMDLQKKRDKRDKKRAEEKAKLDTEYDELNFN
ncbi:hypothetical protein O0L34_g250 [Tuta absoluta]|nr:hypothetical protein O0L34_g250 [Tuta absoluta]